jgi:hypothetical protein
VRTFFLVAITLTPGIAIAIYMYIHDKLVTATFFHGIYDYFLFISFVPGIWVWSFVSLVIVFILARKAIRPHQQASPFSANI